MSLAIVVVDGPTQKVPLHLRRQVNRLHFPSKFDVTHLRRQKFDGERLHRRHCDVTGRSANFRVANLERQKSQNGGKRRSYNDVSKKKDKQKKIKVGIGNAYMPLT